MKDKEAGEWTVFEGESLSEPHQDKMKDKFVFKAGLGGRPENKKGKTRTNVNDSNDTGTLHSEDTPYQGHEQLGLAEAPRTEELHSSGKMMTEVEVVPETQ